MLGFLKKLKPKSYTEERARAENGTVKERTELAQSKKTTPEILYYLAGDPEESVRKAVALNTATPVQTSTVLARDGSVDVRMVLAERLVTLLPDISDDQQSQIYAFAVQALGTLAHDEVLKVRRALATSLKDSAYAPPEIARTLARDIEREVSEPILGFCVALSDEDLLDILSNHPEPWVISAIARRPAVSEPVSKEVIESGDVEAGQALLENETAQIDSDTLFNIIERARNMPEWHKPLALRQDLSLNMAKHLTPFVDDSVVKLLEKRSDFDRHTQGEVRDTVRRRLEFVDDTKKNETPQKKVLRLAKEGRLDEGAISDALSWQDHEFMVLGIAHLAKIPPALAQEILDTKSPKAVVSLVWKAGLSMRMAVQIQRDFLQISHKDLLYARDGLYYPLDDSAMIWQLEFFGIKARS